MHIHHQARKFETLLKEEIQYIKIVFTERNEYLKHIVNNIVR